MANNLNNDEYEVERVIGKRVRNGKVSFPYNNHENILFICSFVRFFIRFLKI